VNCPVCGKENNRGVSNHGEYALRLCLECEVVFADPMKNPGSRWYEQQVNYVVAGIETVMEGLTWNQAMFFKSNNRAGGSLLDVGCGTGHFLFEAKKKGYEVCGLDFNEQSLEVARDRYGMENVFSSSVDDFLTRMPDRKFDYVTLFDVIEHLEDPRGFLEKARALLKPTGRVCLGTVNRKRLLDALGDCDTPPHHLTRWTENSLKVLLNNAGYEVSYLKVKPLETDDIVNFILFRLKTGIVTGMVKEARGDTKSNMALRTKIQALLLVKKVIKVLLTVSVYVLSFFSRFIFKKHGCCIYIEGKFVT
jgi:ubiquinone/menaquinone biosynthesis C-methylase UbiE